MHSCDTWGHCRGDWHSKVVAVKTRKEKVMKIQIPTITDNFYMLL